MRVFWMAALVAMVALPGWAGPKGMLSGPDITAALGGKTLTYADGSRQKFAEDGATIFNNGTESTGHWQVQGDQYCSVWPPSDHWACYDVAKTDDGGISFAAGDGSASVGHYTP